MSPNSDMASILARREANIGDLTACFDGPGEMHYPRRRPPPGASLCGASRLEKLWRLEENILLSLDLNPTMFLLFLE